MKVYDQGSSYRVSLNAYDIGDLADQWPASGLGGVRALWFEFSKKNGDLVDLKRGRWEDRADPGAVLALAEDAMWYGADELGIELPRERRGRKLSRR